MKRKQPSFTQKTSAAKKQRRATTRVPRQATSGLAPELKFLDTAFNTDASTTATIVALTTMATGDTIITRDGNVISARALELRVNSSLEAITQNATLRFVVVCDHGANSAAPTFSGTATTSVFDATTIQAMRNLSCLDKYTILMDKTFVINQSASNAGGVQHHFFKKWIKIPRHCQEVRYQDNTSAIPMKNALSLLYIADVASGVTDVDIAGQARLRFVG